MKNHTILFVSPVPRVATQGRDKQTFTIIDPKTRQTTVTKAMNKTREIGTSVTLKFPLDVLQNRYVTGLDELIPNPFLGMEVEEVLSAHGLNPKWQELLPKLVGQTKISRQSYFEILDNVDPDHYTSLAKGGTMLNFMPSQLLKKEATFIERYSIELFDRPNRFVDDTPRQRMAIQLIKNHNRIANDKLSANPVEHLFYISEENEAEMERMRKDDIIDAAIARKVDLQNKAGDFVNYKVASLLTTYQDKPIVKGVMPQDGVKQAINNYLRDKSHQMGNIEKFNNIMELLTTAEGKQQFEIKYLIQQGMNSNVLDTRDGYLIWNSRSSDKNVYKWTDTNKFVSFLVNEMIIFDPTSDITNWYNELFKEVKNKNVWVE
jgi:hypothetical protein